jgi:hypothetical protein
VLCRRWGRESFSPANFPNSRGARALRPQVPACTELGGRVAEVPVRHRERKYGESKYRRTKILTQIPALLTIFFLVKFTRRPLHFFGRIGSALFAVGFASLLYLTFLWTQSIPIGTRPLLTFGVLLNLIGGQIVFTGLLADLIANMSREKEQRVLLKYTSDAEAHAGLPASTELPSRS